MMMMISYLSISSSASDYKFTKICNAAEASDYSQEATRNAMDKILNQVSIDYPRYHVFCEDGNKENYEMHGEATCVFDVDCYGCVQAAIDYLVPPCGDRLGAQATETHGRCFLSAFEGLLPSVSAHDHDFTKTCNGADAPDYSQKATKNAMDDILDQVKSYYPEYTLFCHDGNKDNYYMHGIATCIPDVDCYGCVKDVVDYLLSACGKKLGAQATDSNGGCFVRFENYAIDDCYKHN
ncbi:hypothetical protein LINPERHAP2_LOCUS17765 [Linum perenne]